MDVVSEAISVVQLGHPDIQRVRTSGRWHTRLLPYDGAGFYAVVAGTSWLIPDGGTPTLLRAGDVVLLPHGTGHVISDRPSHTGRPPALSPTRRLMTAESAKEDDPEETVLLCGKYWLDCSRLHPLLAEMPQVVHLSVREDRHTELRSAIDLLSYELDGKRPGSCIALPSLLDLLLVYTVRAWMADNAGGIWPRVLGDPVAAAALRALHSDPAAPWSNDRLAAEAGVSRPTLARRFSALIGRPPMAYLTWWRLILAATHLRDTSDTLASIAGKVGYGSPYALSHAFEREFGVTPGRYRAEAVVRVASAEDSPKDDGTDSLRIAAGM
ncbi:AraC family transcriptional regulator [Streptomyces parvulus]|uniref:AraC family transcriptional regulator n=1 Tax=Streptomyces parvulus TaxID=146923 RepID=A0A369V1A4_9ACTN|nr:AraC family transcriptional regulator [Streptomyces parvulus]RDD84349.1 AraC family transcriptional regulator [Streptomyces parvulus]